ncbi:sterol desaturase family protein [Noviherbaspirillum massiliense]|uniref:sterol desaturase family protein n=1 Tax=Noviherbaspirillum massiliense TaxID=1465823 RepID=UPI000378FDD8|nr:sterol desaturase family protein [Noviherbaspirillum massiliense]
MSAPIILEIFAGFTMFALVFVTLERYLPFRHQSVLRPGWMTDVTYYVVGCFVGRLSDAITVSAILIIRWAFGFESDGIAGQQPGWLQFIEIVLLADFLAYFYHRGAHQYVWLWRFHKIHHTSVRMDWLANVRVHPLDKILGDCFQLVPIFGLGFSNTPLLAYTIVLGFQGFLNHSNIKVDYGPLRWIIASPTFHHWHHCSVPEAYNKDFAPHLVLFDFLFRTAHIPQGKVPPNRYGLSESMPNSFWGQMIVPFLRRTPPAASTGE